MNSVLTLVDSARWFSALGRYRAGAGPIALTDLSAWADCQPAPVAGPDIGDDMTWLPSSPSEPDPIYGSALRDELQSLEIASAGPVMASYKAALQALRIVPDRSIAIGAHDFTHAAKGAALYCVRMATLEALVQRAGFWHEALRIYQAGHWPCGRTQKSELVVF